MPIPTRKVVLLVLVALATGCTGHQRLKMKAQMGNPEAMWQYGMDLWEHSTGRKDETDEAIAWITKAANAGQPNAMYDLALIYGGGGGTIGPRPEAVAWLRKGAEAGNRPSMIKLAEAYRYGWLGLPIDKAEARRWYDAADRARKPGEM